MQNKSPKQIAIDIVKELDLPVFPCKFNKSPYTMHGYKDATKDLSQINNFWTNFPEALIGVPTGKETGLFIVDIDDGKGKSGEETFIYLGLSNPDTVQTITQSGGRHLIFKYDHSIPQNSSTSKIGKFIDTKGNGGYVIWAAYGNTKALSTLSIPKDSKN